MLSVLFLNEYARSEIDKNVLCDLNLDLVFPNKTIEIMRLVCNAEDIAARQEMFRAMESEPFRNILRDMQNLLLDLSQKENAVSNAKSECEKYFQFCLLIKSYLCLSDYLCGITFSPNCTYINRLASYAKLRIRNTEALREIFNEYRRTTEDISHFTARCDTRISHILRATDTDLSVNEKIIRDSEKLGFCIAPSSRHFEKLRLGEGLSEALIRTFQNEFYTLSVLMQKATAKMELEILKLKEELDFYFSVYDLVQKAKDRNIPHSYARIAPTPRYFIKKAYDITLVSQNAITIVPNDIDFDEENRIYFLTGANGGGKTTYLRTCAVNLILFLSGCPIFCETDVRGENAIFPFRDVFTHFPSDEGYESVGRLEEESARVQNITQRMTKDSFAFFNESFGGADERNGERLTLETAVRIKNIGAFALFVTHFNKQNYSDFSMLSTIIDVKNENNRTFLIQKSTVAENAYAVDILKKYGLDRQSLEQRISSSE